MNDSEARSALLAAWAVVAGMIVAMFVASMIANCGGA